MPFDISKRQKKRDDRLPKGEQSKKEATAEKEKTVDASLRKRKRDFEQENKSQEFDGNSNDKDFILKDQ